MDSDTVAIVDMFLSLLAELEQGSMTISETTSSNGFDQQSVSENWSSSAFSHPRFKGREFSYYSEIMYVRPESFLAILFDTYVSVENQTDEAYTLSKRTFDSFYEAVNSYIEIQTNQIYKYPSVNPSATVIIGTYKSTLWQAQRFALELSVSDWRDFNAFYIVISVRQFSDVSLMGETRYL